MVKRTTMYARSGSGWSASSTERRKSDSITTDEVLTDTAQAQAVAKSTSKKIEENSTSTKCKPQVLEIKQNLTKNGTVLEEVKKAPEIANHEAPTEKRPVVPEKAEKPTTTDNLAGNRCKDTSTHEEKSQSSHKPPEKDSLFLEDTFFESLPPTPTEHWAQAQWSLHHKALNAYSNLAKTAKNSAASPSVQRVCFLIYCRETRFGDELRIVGNLPMFGNWQPIKGIKMTTDPSSFPYWTSPELEIPLHVEVEYKYVIVNEGRSHVRWEDKLGSNRLLRLDPSKDRSDVVNGDIYMTSRNCIKKIAEDPDLALVVADDYRFNELPCKEYPNLTPFSTAHNIPTLSVVPRSICKEVESSISGSWRLMFDRSDSLIPFMELTGVSWIIKKAVQYSRRYDINITVMGDQIILRTTVEGGTDVQTFKISGCIHKTRELDEELYSTVSVWNSNMKALESFKVNQEKGCVKAVRRLTMTEENEEVLETTVEYTPFCEDKKPLKLSFIFSRISNHA